MLLHSSMTIANNIVYFKIAVRNNFECSHCKEMVSVWGDVYATYPDWIIIQCIHVSKHHTLPPTYVQILGVN